MRSCVLDEVSAYYSSKLEKHGVSPEGVDWNSEHGQAIRFEQLIKVVRGDDNFSINDLGCGYGALLEYVRGRFPRAVYFGCDVSQAMIDAAAAAHGLDDRASFNVAKEPFCSADYGVASGIFNVKLGCPLHEWRQHVIETVDALNRTSRRGFAFNCLTSYSDSDKMRSHLYYADPLEIFDHCKRNYSRNIALLHDYDLYEFTILVRK
jgi:SAM-dependent methyltransferase